MNRNDLVDYYLEKGYDFDQILKALDYCSDSNELDALLNIWKEDPRRYALFSRDQSKYTHPLEAIPEEPSENLSQ